MTSSLNQSSIHAALCYIQAKSLVNYNYKSFTNFWKKLKKYHEFNCRRKNFMYLLESTRCQMNKKKDKEKNVVGKSEWLLLLTKQLQTHNEIYALTTWACAAFVPIVWYLAEFSSPGSHSSWRYLLYRADVMAWCLKGSKRGILTGPIYFNDPDDFWFLCVSHNKMSLNPILTRW